jgi:hypothetical protein
MADLPSRLLVRVREYSYKRFPKKKQMVTGTLTIDANPTKLSSVICAGVTVFVRCLFP